jgi:hypothetical protein
MDRRRFLLTSLPMMRESFFQGLCDLGYVEGRNVRIEYRDAQESQELLWWSSSIRSRTGLFEASRGRVGT